MLNVSKVAFLKTAVGTILLLGMMSDGRWGIAPLYRVSQVSTDPLLLG